MARLFWGGVLAFLLVFWLAHAVLRKAAAEADPFLLPFAALLSGLGLILVYSVKDPYRDTFAFGGQVWGVALYGMVALLLPLSRPFGRLPLRRYGYAYAGASAFLMLLLLVLRDTGRAGFISRCSGLNLWSSSRYFWCCLSPRIWPSGRGHLGDPKATLCRDCVTSGRWPWLTGSCCCCSFVVKDLGPAVLLFGVFLGLLSLTTRQALVSGRRDGSCCCWPHLSATICTSGSLRPA